MTKVVWYFQGEEEEHTTEVPTTFTDVLQALNLVGSISFQSQQFRVIETELVIDDGPPYIAVLLEV